MLLDLIQNFWLGFIITAIPGAVLLEAMRRSVSPDHHLVPYIAGNFIGMVTVITLAFAGVSVLENSIAGNLFSIISALMLFIIGVSAVMRTSTDANSKGVAIGSKTTAALTGLVLATANPLSFVFWLSLIGNFRSTYTVAATILSIIAIILGALLVFIALIVITRKFNHLITPRRERIASRLLGSIIIMYGAIIIYRAFM